MDMVKGFSFMSEDGVIVRIEETPERERVILSMSRAGKVETASLDKDMFEAFMDLHYHLTVHSKKMKEEGDAA
jgi:hypothetical protein